MFLIDVGVKVWAEKLVDRSLSVESPNVSYCRSCTILDIGFYRLYISFIHVFCLYRIEAIDNGQSYFSDTTAAGVAG